MLRASDSNNSIQLSNKNFSTAIGGVRCREYLLLRLCPGNEPRLIKRCANRMIAKPKRCTYYRVCRTAEACVRSLCTSNGNVSRPKTLHVPKRYIPTIPRVNVGYLCGSWSDYRQRLSPSNRTRIVSIGGAYGFIFIHWLEPFSRQNPRGVQTGVHDTI